MKTSFYCYKSAIILTLFLSFTVADALVVNSVSDVSVDNYHCARGDSVEVDFTVDYICKVLGPGESFTLEAYASSDTIITEDDIYLGSGRRRVTWGSGSLTGTFTCRFPIDIPPGYYYVGIICRGHSDYDPNPVFIDPEIVPDLALTYIGIWDSYSIMSGGSGSVDLTVENIGSYESGDFFVYLYVSEDSTITEDDYEVSHFRVYDSLDPGDETSISRAFSLPDDIPLGDYYIGGIVDCTNDDNIENNSCCGDSFSVVEPIDISVQNVSVDPENCIPGISINVTVTVENIEKMSSDGYTVDYYASTNYTTTYFLGSLERSGLSSGETDTFDHLCQLPQDIPQGQYYIVVKLTCDNDNNDDNNEGLSFITVGPSSNLAVESVEAADGTYIPGDQITVYTLIKNIGDVASQAYTVDYYASTDANITASDYHIGYVNRSGLEPNEQHSYETKCGVPFNIPADNHYIGIIITCPQEYDPANNVGRTSSTVEIVHPAGYVCGQMQYQDTRRKEHPIRYAMVKIYEDVNNDDPLDDRVIGQTHTDHNGNYGVTVQNDANSVHDIYVRVFTEGFSGAYPGTTSKICILKDDVLDETYSLESPPYPHPQDSSIVINMIAPEGVGEFMVFDSVIEGFHKAKTFFGIELSEIATYWPCSEDTSYYDPCDVGIFISQDDRGDRDVIMHEYGHYIADIYSFTQGSVGDNPVHFWNLDLRYNPVNRSDEEARNLAFREAWASLFSIATQLGDYGYPNSGETMYQDEDWGSGKSLEVDLEADTRAHNSPGQYYENMNCCALWDIFDDNDHSEDDNDTLSDTSLSKIWTVTRDCQPDDIIDFWNSWFRSFNHESEITRIFQDHEMMFIKPETTRSDLNYDNIVNFHDFSKFAEHYPSSPGNAIYHEKYDLNNDNVISIDDLSYLVQDWLLSRQD